MDNIRLNTGELILLDTNEDVKFYLEKYMGDEFASYVYDELSSAQEKEDYNYFKAQTDADAIAEENDELRSALINAEASIEEIINFIYGSKRLDKEKLYQKLSSTRCNIHNVY